VTPNEKLNYRKLIAPKLLRSQLSLFPTVPLMLWRILRISLVIAARFISADGERAPHTLLLPFLEFCHTYSAQCRLKVYLYWFEIKFSMWCAAAGKLNGKTC